MTRIAGNPGMVAEARGIDDTWSCGPGAGGMNIAPIEDDDAADSGVGAATAGFDGICIFIIGLGIGDATILATGAI